MKESYLGEQKLEEVLRLAESIEMTDFFNLLFQKSSGILNNCSATVKMKVNRNTIMYCEDNLSAASRRMALFEA